MKYLITSVVLLLLYTQAFSQVKKKALLVGVGDYPGSQWKDLSSANDLKYLTEALTLQNFSEITTLADNKATKDGILAALRELEKNAGQDDIILFHFSGHGQQIQDNENKDETDGYDEALIPHDAIEGFYSIDYKGDKHLRDDEIQPILNSIRNKIGKNGSLVVVLDACHSGTMTRTGKISVTRGESIPFKNPKYVAPNVFVAGDGFADAGASASNMIVLSASSPNQVNYETKDVNGKGVGSLSYALARALSELPKGANYNVLFNRIKSEIQGNFPGQIPMMEGNGKQEIFGSAYTSYDDIVEVKWDNDSTIRIPAGLLHGLSGSSVIDLYISGKDQKVMQATPLDVGNFETVARTSQRAASKVGYHAKWESSFGVYAADLFINAKNATKHSKSLSSQLTAYIGRQQNINITTNADFLLDIDDADAAKGIRVELVERGDSVRWSTTIKAGDTLSDRDKENMIAHLRNAMKVKFLRSMHDGGSLSDDIIVELIPKKPVIINDQIQIREREEFDIRITNKGNNDVYFTIINILPDNTAKVLIPDPGYTPQEFLSKAKGAPFELKGFSVDENTPKGQEIFKVIFSRTPMDLRNIFIGVRDRGPGEMLSFESALQEMVETSTTGTRSGRSNVKLGEVGITTVGFTVVK